MGENLPPSTGGGNPDATRGIPYYEKLKKDLRETLQKKRLLDRNMASLETQIFQSEAAYLEETSAGNIIKGFDNYIKGSGTTSGGAGTAGVGGTATRRKGTITDHDRVFSRSSASFTRESSPQSSTHTTPSHVPTPTATVSMRESNQPTPPSTASLKGTSNTKKNKKAPEKDEDESEGKPPKRIKITYARGEKNAE